MYLGIPTASPSYQATLPPPQLHLGTFTPKKGMQESARPKLLGDSVRHHTQNVQKLFIMQNVNFYKKFNIHHMVTESHLPVKKRYKSYILYYRVHNQGNRAFLQGNQKTSSYAALAECAGQPLVPPTPFSTPHFRKSQSF